MHIYIYIYIPAVYSTMTDQDVLHVCILNKLSTSWSSKTVSPVRSYNTNTTLELLRTKLYASAQRNGEPTIQYTLPAFFFSFYSPCRYDIPHDTSCRNKMLQFPRGWWVRGSVGCTLACDAAAPIISPGANMVPLNNMDSGRSCSTCTWSPPPRIFQRTRETAWSR